MALTTLVSTEIRGRESVIWLVWPESIKAIEERLLVFLVLKQVAQCPGEFLGGHWLDAMLCGELVEVRGYVRLWFNGRHAVMLVRSQPVDDDLLRDGIDNQAVPLIVEDG